MNIEKIKFHLIMKKNLPFLSVLCLSTLIFTAGHAQLSVSLGNDTTLCRGSEIVLDAGIIPGVDDINYEWNGNPDLTDRYFTVTVGGKYWVKITSPQFPGDEAKDTITIIDVELPEFQILPSVMEYYCKGEQVELSPDVTQANWIYEWETDGKISLTANTIADTTGKYTLTVTDENNCVTVKSVNLEFQYPWEEDKVLLATYDPEEKKNIVIWQKTPGKRTESYIIFRGDNPEDLLGSVPIEEVNLVVDTEWDPGAGPAQYNCILSDKNLSLVSPDRIHQTLHLSVVKTAEEQIKLTWSRYKGFEYPHFEILRGTGPDNLEPIHTIPDNKGEEIFSYIDPDGGSAPYYYQIRINTPEEIRLITEPGKKAGAGPFVHSFSNLEDNQHGTGTGSAIVVEDDLTVFPNPYSGITNIRYRLKEQATVHIEVLNLLGQRIAVLQYGFQEAGTHMLQFSARKLGMPAGMYYLKMEIDGSGAVIRKIIER